MKKNICHSQTDKNIDSCHQAHQSFCHSPKGRIDKLLWGSLCGVVILYLYAILLAPHVHIDSWDQRLSVSVFELMNTMWWGIFMGIIMVSLVSKIPKEFVISILGNKRDFKSILRATAAGFLLDLCNHGILMVGAKLYDRGASIGQVMAFLIASPWNSFSLTLILFALIGLSWTLAFIALSMLIAIVVGLAFNALVKHKVLMDNPAAIDLPADFHFFSEAKKSLSTVRVSPSYIWDLIVTGIKESRMVLRWLLFGVLLASLIRTFLPPDQFGTFFGPTLLGLGLTLVAATIIEVCSEGSTPIAADLLTRASAPGNSFAFLMTGVATDYTEIMVLKDTTKSWKIALFLPLLTVPQVIIIAVLLNL